MQGHGKFLITKKKIHVILHLNHIKKTHHDSVCILVIVRTIIVFNLCLLAYCLTYSAFEFMTVIQLWTQKKNTHGLQI